MPRYLITGGAGFIGANVACHFLARGASVRIFDNLSRVGATRNIEWLHDRFGDQLTVVERDVRDADAVAKAVADADVVLHFAAQVAVSNSVIEPRNDLEINVMGTFNVLEAARRSCRRPIVLYSSTNKVYGELQVPTTETATRYHWPIAWSGGITEERPLAPVSPYGCSKGAAEQYVTDYSRTYGLRTIVFRQSCIYGPRQFGIEDQGWMAWFGRRAFERRRATIFGTGKQVRDVLFVSDLVEACAAAIDCIDRTAGEAYNIGGGPLNTLSILELVAELRRRVSETFDCDYAESRPGDQQIFVSNIGKATSHFGWTPKVSVAEGLGRLLDWIRECPNPASASARSARVTISDGSTANRAL